MACKFTKGEHDWILLLSWGATDYEPGDEAWWCKSCGRAETFRVFDGRKFGGWSKDPRINQIQEPKA